MRILGLGLESAVQAGNLDFDRKPGLGDVPRDWWTSPEAGGRPAETGVRPIHHHSPNHPNTQNSAPPENQ